MTTTTNLKAVRTTKPDVQDSDAGSDRSKAHTVLHPIYQASRTLREYDQGAASSDLGDLAASLGEQTLATNDGDLGRGEAMLTAQAHTLDAIFNKLARMAINAEYVDQLDRLLKLGLRAQAQCRATWEAISAIKNPPLVGYVKQANIAAGHQQVNNGSVPEGAGNCARRHDAPPNKPLERKNGQRLDARTESKGIETDTPLETMEEVHRTENSGR